MSYTQTSSSFRGPAAQIRALFLDIDGTLAGADGTISPGVIDAVRRVRAHGCEVVLCTGRTRYRTVPIAERLGPPLGYAVTSNGGVLSHLGTGRILYRRLLPVPIALEVIRTLRNAGAEPFVYEDSDVPGAEGARVLYHPDAAAVAHGHADERYSAHPELMTDLPFQPVSVSTYGRPEVIRPLAALLRERLASDLSIVQSGTEHAWGVEIYVSGISKRTGLEILAARLEVDRTEVMAIGDHINDIEMIEWAGLGVAMGNAQAEVLAVADSVTESIA
ncbi:MAG TPA: Cof-type HAD-IIB family hydrolase, partial [Chthonomonadaceae bacterium]|nr:Cof-type HAD-IIB family hydrolase [Chthonomonadaceae bacterium]